MRSVAWYAVLEQTRRDGPVEERTSPLAEEFRSVSELKFDLENHRFVDFSSDKEEDVIAELYEQADIDELLKSILSAGYINFEPLIVLRQGNIVLEGNRRLAALRLLADEKLRRSLEVKLPDIPSQHSLPEQIRVFVVDNRDDARAYIGFKHINGPFKWDALAKAKYAADWLKSGGNIDDISRTLGDNHSTVRRLVNGWFALEQAKSRGFDPDDITKRSFSFSHLYTALTRAPVREYLGIADQDVSVNPQPNPIPESRGPELDRLMSWLYGQEKKGEPTLIQSQNPNLNQLSQVLANTEAHSLLLAERQLSPAFERVEPVSKRFVEALVLASKNSEDALSLSSHYDGDATMLRVSENLFKSARTIRNVLQQYDSAQQDS